MTPSIHRWRKYRFQFHSREEDRPHIHIIGPDGKAKIWLSPQVAIAYNRGIPSKDLKRFLAIVERRHHEFLEAWEDYFSQSSH